MKREQRNRNERGQLAVKIVCGAIASLLAGAFAASELFALTTRFSGSLGEHYLYLYPPWGHRRLVVQVAHERSGTLHPAFAARRRLSRSTLPGVHNPWRDSLAGLARVQRHPWQCAVGEAFRHQAGGLD